MCQFGIPLPVAANLAVSETPFSGSVEYAELENPAGPVSGRNLWWHVRTMNIQDNTVRSTGPAAAIRFKHVLRLTVLVPVNGDARIYFESHR
jgi:hypothetical protein